MIEFGRRRRCCVTRPKDHPRCGTLPLAADALTNIGKLISSARRNVSTMSGSAFIEFKARDQAG